MLIFAIFTLVAPLPSPPYNTLQEGFLEFQVPSTPLHHIIPAVPTGAGNAADDYRNALKLYRQTKGIIDSTADIERVNAATAASDPWANPGYKACREVADLVAGGVTKAEMRYTFVYTPTRLTPHYHRKFASDLWWISLGPSQCYHLHLERKEYAKAEKRMQDMLILGWHLFSERAVPYMTAQGLDILDVAVQRLIELYNVWPDGPTDRLASLKSYQAELLRIKENSRQKKKLLWDSLPNPMGNNEDLFNPGDVFNMVENEEDRAWQVQAILTLGAMKYRVASRGDKKKTHSLINQYLGSEDPLLKAAADCADAMTLQQYQGLAEFPDEEDDDY